VIKHGKKKAHPGKLRTESASKKDQQKKIFSRGGGRTPMEKKKKGVTKWPNCRLNQKENPPFKMVLGYQWGGKKSNDQRLVVVWEKTRLQIEYKKTSAKVGQRR